MDREVEEENFGNIRLNIPLALEGHTSPWHTLPINFLWKQIDVWPSLVPPLALSAELGLHCSVWAGLSITQADS